MVVAWSWGSSTSNSISISSGNTTQQWAFSILHCRRAVGRWCSRNFHVW